jgi:predicted transcriptional regulator
VARRVVRDVKAVHGGVRGLVDAGLVEATAAGVRFRYRAVHVDFTLDAA